jgi:indolepyruvate ferredoxin oxidoreductase beta subunit
MKKLGRPLNLIVSGVGGQGNILISRLVGRTLSKKGYRVTIGETFGAAQRGGAVFSSLRISESDHYGPLIPMGRGDVVLSLEPIEALRILSTFGNPDTMTISNTRPVLPVGVLAERQQYPNTEELFTAIRHLSNRAWFVDASEMAIELGMPIVANIIMLGAMVGSGACPIEFDEVAAEIRSVFGVEKSEINMKALEMGYLKTARV